MNLSKEQIIEEILKGSKIGKKIFEIEMNYYKDLAKDNSPTKTSTENGE